MFAKVKKWIHEKTGDLKAAQTKHQLNSASTPTQDHSTPVQGENTAKSLLPRRRAEDEEQDADKKLKTLYFWILALVGVALLPTLDQPFFAVCHRDLRTFLEELAFAAILAGVFGLTIEKYHREEFTKFVKKERAELKQNVFLYAYGHDVAEQTRQEMRSLLECAFFREHVRLDWHLAPIEGKPDKLRVMKTFTYYQTNGTLEPQSYEYQLHVSNVSPELEPEERRTVAIKRNRKQDPLLNLPTADGKFESGELGPIDPGERIEVSVTIEEVRLRTGDDSYTSRHPIIGITLVTVHVDPALDIRVKAFCKSRELIIRADHHPDRGIHAWELSQGTLPYQSIIVSWKSSETMHS